jgi:septal ring factor EnvC (AmiA/AmiB activator)|tara:strand:+ start:955 stop:1167 length:213 start_codon:yes stop_codon:yes gene_type:complete
MAIEVEQLKEEQRGLQVDFDKLAKNIKQVEADLNQMKANLNAINGAVQQVSKLIGMAGEDPVKTKDVKKV